MVVDPDPMLHRWVEAGCELVIVHAEAVTHLHRTLARIRELGALTGVALNPATPLAAVEHVWDLVDLLLVMTVDPGFGGQRDLPEMEPKIAAARREIHRRGLAVELEVDGGIGLSTVGAAARAGATAFCAGSALFTGPGTVADRAAALRAEVERGMTAASTLRTDGAGTDLDDLAVTILASSPPTRSSRRTAAIRGCPSARPRRPGCCGAATCAMTRPVRTGPIVTVWSCQLGTGRCCCTRCCTWPATTCPWTNYVGSASGTRPHRAIPSGATPPAWRPPPDRWARGWPTRWGWRWPSGCPPPATTTAEHRSSTTHLRARRTATSWRGSARGGLAGRPPRTGPAHRALRRQRRHHRRAGTAVAQRRRGRPVHGVRLARDRTGGRRHIAGLEAALEDARSETAPSLIPVRSTIGYGADKAGTSAAHGAPLGAADRPHEGPLRLA